MAQGIKVRATQLSSFLDPMMEEENLSSYFPTYTHTHTPTHRHVHTHVKNTSNMIQLLKIKIISPR